MNEAFSGTKCMSLERSVLVFEQLNVKNSRREKQQNLIK
jgi:hypothetical protein